MTYSVYLMISMVIYLKCLVSKICFWTENSTHIIICAILAHQGRLLFVTLLC